MPGQGGQAGGGMMMNAGQGMNGEGGGMMNVGPQGGVGGLGGAVAMAGINAGHQGGMRMGLAVAAGAPRPKVPCQHPGCGKEFSWQQDLAKHVRKYHSGEEPRFQCGTEGCLKRFYERKLLVAHERTHTDERPFPCSVPGCDKRFRARNALAYHLKVGWCKLKPVSRGPGLSASN